MLKTKRRDKTRPMKNSLRDIDQADIHTHHHHHRRFYLFTYSVNCLLRSPLIFQVHRDHREIIFFSSSENRSRQGSFSYSYTHCPLPFYLFLSGLLDRRRHIESMSIYTSISFSLSHSILTRVNRYLRLLSRPQYASTYGHIKKKKERKKERKLAVMHIY